MAPATLTTLRTKRTMTSEDTARDNVVDLPSREAPRRAPHRVWYQPANTRPIT